eukprot:TRINITY_DN3509_c0_g1_i1.p1 TRINITY_DN3509_c0_g1~~TRINITY_DN3509_c0_g1_i1.p1  ORF type:complete len:308 (-),score=67.83 TRINITY_DN3509_c0_g1_i1:55-978(-)
MKKIYAMKVMRKDIIIAKNQVEHTRDEKHILHKIKHPFIVNLNYAFQTPDCLYMVLDFVNGGELFYHLSKETVFSKERVQFYAAEIASALIHLHSHGIIYRDLKPENILLDMHGHIVITDFGLSKEVMDSATDTFCGTPEYLAPEVLKGIDHTYPVDWWSLGTLVYEMLSGLPPFYSEDIPEMYDQIVSGTLMFPEEIDSVSRDFLSGLLNKDPYQRAGGPAIREHPFFEGIDWDLLEARKLTPPWKPNVKDEFDITQIDPSFTNEDPIMDEDGYDIDLDLFDGFTFQGEPLLAGGEKSESSSEVNI